MALKSILRAMAVGAAAIALALSMPARAADLATAKTHHFATDDDSAGFVLDQSGPYPRLQLTSDGEVFALDWRPAVNGDRLLVRDDGEVVLRSTVLGGWTLFSERFKTGVPVAAQKPARPLEWPPPPVEVVQEHAAESAAKLRQAFGVPVRIEADWKTAAQDAGMRSLLFDSLRNASGGLAMLAQEPPAREAVARHLRRLHFAAAPRPGLVRSGQTVTVSFSLNDGLKGRWSSYRLAQELRPLFR
jgi:hypothetical protein